MSSNYSEKLDKQILEVIHLFTSHLSQEKRYELLNLKPLTEEVLDLWFESLKRNHFSFMNCNDQTCLWNLAQAPS